MATALILSWTLAAIVCLGLTGCSLPGMDDWNDSYIENGTDSPITVYVVQPEGEEAFIELPPREAGSFGTGCNGFALVARTRDGEEVDRLPAETLCDNETWVVGGD